MGIIVSQAARELGVSARTVSSWALKGKVRSVRTPGGWRLYDPEDIAKLKRELERKGR